VLHGVLKWDVAGTARFYKSDNEDEARQLYDDRAEYDAEFLVKPISPVTVVLSTGMSKVPLGIKWLRHVAELLYKEGFKHALLERAEGRTMPFAVFIGSGPLEGLWHIDLTLVVAGADGSY